ncbi:MAG: fibrillarin-like rRNA/tRNA 2'-O-methyltransferase [Nanoarchaeota archaeon]|nr:fibrillarin-like rRNA/tRNA 2'-O-methyltransferase [Nanoarchaeota archaeon]
MKLSKIFEVYEERGRLHTKNLIRGNTVYTERLVKEAGEEYREWDPRKSKLCAAILKGCTNIGIRKGDIVLYLGASTGTTPSHVSDIVGQDGFIFALDFAPRVVRELVFVAEKRKNIAPILADANNPESFKDRISQVDIVYMDIAQKNQAEIFLKNIKEFLKPGGYALLAVKAKSVDIARKPKAIYNEVRQKLEKEVTIIDFRTLEPFELDHCMFVCKTKGPSDEVS